MASADEKALLRDLLKQVSRSFYLTLRLLPRAIRRQVSLAYLLARTTDTIADTELIPVEKRLAALQDLRNRILGTTNSPLNFGEFARQQGSTAERLLLDRVETSLALLESCVAPDVRMIRKVLDTITSGQELDLRRFAVAGARTPSSTSSDAPATADEGIRAPGVIALKTDTELDDYTYRVAGCVGEFWTEMCVTHLFRVPQLEDLALASSFEQLGVRFGKGLQLVNILRDLPVDLRKRRCYVPLESLNRFGLTPEALLLPKNESRFVPLYNSLLDRAESHLAAGWHYTNLIPFTRMSLRLACALPILIGAETIKLLRAENPLDPERRIKISRSDVKRIAVRSVARYPFPKAWSRLFPRPFPLAGKDIA